MDVNDLHSSADSAAGAAPAPQSTAASAATPAQPAPAPTLEAEVSALVGSLGSWWSGVSKKSAEQLASAREQINAQGGILALARSEAAKFEAQLTAAQASAREAAQTPLDSAGEKSSKGKGKAKDDDEWLGDSRREKEGEYSEEGEALPLSPEERGLLRQQSDLHDKASQSELDDIANAGRAALGSAQAWFSSLAEDKRLKDLQSSLSSTIASISNTSAPQADGEPAGQRQLLPSLVSSIQASLPHLDLKQSEALAKRYWDQSQLLAKDVGVEVKAMMGDLVKVVPPEEADGKQPAVTSAPRSSGEESAAAKPAAASVPMSAAASTTEASDAGSEAFEWDTDAEHASRPERVAAPPVVSDAPQRTALPSAAAGGAEKPGTAAAKEDDADSGDSDWE